MFDLAPVSLWLEDYSARQDAVRRVARRRRDRSARPFRAPTPRAIKACSGRIRVLKVNRSTLALFEAADLDASRRQSRPRLPRRHARPPMSRNWRSSGTGRRRSPATPSTTRSPAGGSTSSSQGRILPGHEDSWARVLIAIEDVTERENARREHADSDELCARPVRAFAGVALGRGFQRHQEAARRDAATAASPISASSPTCIPNSSSAA